MEKKKSNVKKENKVIETKNGKALIMRFRESRDELKDIDSLTPEEIESELALIFLGLRKDTFGLDIGAKDRIAAGKILTEIKGMQKANVNVTMKTDKLDMLSKQLMSDDDATADDDELAGV